jgi:hypothetical protein
VLAKGDKAEAVAKRGAVCHNTTLKYSTVTAKSTHAVGSKLGQLSFFFPF